MLHWLPFLLPCTFPSSFSLFFHFPFHYNLTILFFFILLLSFHHLHFLFFPTISFPVSLQVSFSSSFTVSLILHDLFFFSSYLFPSSSFLSSITLSFTLTTTSSISFYCFLYTPSKYLSTSRISSQAMFSPKSQTSPRLTPLFLHFLFHDLLLFHLYHVLLLLLSTISCALPQNTPPYAKFFSQLIFPPTIQTS